MHSGSAPPPVRFSAFTKRFGPTTAVEGLSFDVAAGRVVGLLGRNGAGKSTSLRGLLGLVRPTSGSALVHGAPYAALTHPARRVGASMEGIGFTAGHTCRRHLEICARACGLPKRRVDDVLELVDLRHAADRPIRHCSTGMRQRLSLAAALLGDPELLVLDEPASGLDPDGVRWLRDFIRGLADGGRAVLLSSHQLAEVEQTVDDVVVIQRSLIFAGPLEELTGARSGRLEERFFDLVGSATAGVRDA